MRSEQVYRAIQQGNTRYEICQLGSKGVRIMHARGTPIEESIGKVLTLIGLYPAAALRFKPTDAPDLVTELA